MPQSRIAALQIGASPLGKAETLQQILAFEDAIRAERLALVVMPEALLGGYPKGETFGTRLGYRLPEGRDAFARYHGNAIDVPGPETDALAGLSARSGASLVTGVIERAGATLYCTALFFDPAAGLVAAHRKLMPTGTERLIWGKATARRCRWWRRRPAVPARRSAGRTTCRCCAWRCTRRA
ncbi:Nitrilase [Burkholderia glumae]|nr:Nitrilase [Burkholderia glumae]